MLNLTGGLPTVLSISTRGPTNPDAVEKAKSLGSSVLFCELLRGRCQVFSSVAKFAAAFGSSRDGHCCRRGTVLFLRMVCQFGETLDFSLKRQSEREALRDTVASACSECPQSLQRGSMTWCDCLHFRPPSVCDHWRKSMIEGIGCLE